MGARYRVVLLRVSSPVRATILMLLAPYEMPSFIPTSQALQAPGLFSTLVSVS